MNKFEVAVRNKYRFPYKGMISVEDLWDLSLTSLDSVYKTLNSEKKQSEEDSLMSTKDEKTTELQNKIDIVKYIYSEKVAEREKKKMETENRAKKQRIMEILANKQNAALENMSEEELKAMLESM